MADAAACLLYLSMTCNNIMMSTPGSTSPFDTPIFSPSTAHKTLVTHMLGRVWNGKGTLDKPNPPQFNCTSVTISEVCGEVRVSYSSYSDTAYPVDAFEANLIKQIWGPLWTTGVIPAH